MNLHNYGDELNKFRNQGRLIWILLHLLRRMWCPLGEVDTRCTFFMNKIRMDVGGSIMTLTKVGFQS